MLSRFMLDPLTDMRAIDNVFERMFGERFGSTTGQQLQAATLPVDILERDNKLIVRAAIPGVRPEDIDVSVENNILTIRGETKSEQEDKDAKVYRREVSYGSFVRSIRLPDNLMLEEVDAEFRNGCVEITIPRKPEAVPKSLRVNVRSSEQGGEKALINGQRGDKEKAGASK